MEKANFDEMISSRVQETATISIERFLDLIADAVALQNVLEHRNELQRKYDRLKAYVLEKNFRDWYIDNDSCVDFDSSLFAISDRYELREMGISVEEQESFVRKKKFVREHSSSKEEESEQ